MKFSADISKVLPKVREITISLPKMYDSKFKYKYNIFNFFGSFNLLIIQGFNFFLELNAYFKYAKQRKSR